MTYYGQDLIDKWLVEHCHLPEKGVIVDIGAGDGKNMSNSLHFEEQGWTAICVDADPRVTKDLLKNRKHGYGALISNKGGMQPLYMNDKTPDISGIYKTPGNKDHSELLPTVKLETILEKEKIKHIDILSIDTEGSEIDVFESMDWNKHKPHYLVIEFDTQGVVNLAIEPYFTGKGYKVIGIVGPNMIFELPEPIVKDPHLIVYGSSYDRGLEHLLKTWPDIKKAVPDARLRIFYGWNLFDVGYHDNPERMSWKEKMNKLMEQDGITHLGRIGHEAVIKEFEMAGIWAYPTHFGEISCITAMKAQAYGAVPCVIEYAALKETVQFGVKVKGDIYDKETKELYKNALIALLNDPIHQENVRNEMISWARKTFPWSVVAKQWHEEFKREITPEEKAMQLIMSDEPLEALQLLTADSPLRQKLVRKLDHMFNPQKYLEKYANDPMNWKPGTVDYPRHKWILQQVGSAKSLLDLGCYEGSLVAKFGKGGKGVEVCKAAVEDCKKRGLDVVQGDAITYQDENKYDAVVACELIEHVPEPKKLIDNMLSLVSDTGWCYVTTPHGCYDTAGTQKVWDDEDALIDHVRTYNKEKIQALLAGCDVGIATEGKELYIKFRRNLDKQVVDLLENNQALKAWNLVKDTNWPKKDRLWLAVKHAFNKDDYIKYYSEQLVENPVPEEFALDCTKLYPRFKWLVEQIEKQQPKKVLDLGCADGYVGITLAKRGIEQIEQIHGVNLYKPSIDIAIERAKKFNVDLQTTFEVRDLMDFDPSWSKYDSVILFEVLEHVPNPQEVINHCMSLVAKNGSFYLSTPSPDHIGIKLHKEEQGRHEGDWDDGLPSGHLQIFTEKELRDMLKGYTIKQFLVDEQGCFMVEVKNG